MNRKPLFNAIDLIAGNASVRAAPFVQMFIGQLFQALLMWAEKLGRSSTQSYEIAPCASSFRQRRPTPSPAPASCPAASRVLLAGRGGDVGGSTTENFFGRWGLIDVDLPLWGNLGWSAWTERVRLSRSSSFEQPAGSHPA